MVYMCSIQWWWVIALATAVDIWASWFILINDERTRIIVGAWGLLTAKESLKALQIDLSVWVW